MSDDKSFRVDERDMIAFDRPIYRVLTYHSIADGFYGVTEAWEVSVDNARLAIEWCERRLAAKSVEPQRMELYACTPHSGSEATELSNGRVAQLSILLQAWNHRVETIEDQAGQIVEIHTI